MESLRWAVLLGAIALAAFAMPQGRNSLPSIGTGKAHGRTIDTAWFFPPTAAGSRAPRANARGENAFPGLGTIGASPANADIAVGPDEVVQVVNGQIAFFAKDGTQTFGQTASAFFGGLAETASPSMPQAVFDLHSNRFFVLFLESDAGARISNFLLAVSDDDTAEGNWFQYKFSAVGNLGVNEHWSRQPSLAIDEDGLLVTTTIVHFDNGSIGGSLFTIVPKIPALVGGTIAFKKLVDFFIPGAVAGETLGTDPPCVYAVTKRAQNEFRIYRTRDMWTEINAGVNFVDHVTTQVPAPPATVASTDGGAIETGGINVIAVAGYDDRVFAAVNMNNGAPLSRIRWFVWDVSRLMFGTVDNEGGGTLTPASGSWFMPGAGVNAHGDFGLLFTSAGTAVTSDIVVSGRRALDPFAMILAPSPMASATGTPYVGTSWGAWNGVGADGGDGETLWGTAMVVRPGGVWGTEVVRWWVTRTYEALPVSHSWFRGTAVSGNLGSLFFADGSYLVGRAGPASVGEPPAQLVAEGQAPPGDVFSIEVGLVCRVGTSGLGQRIELWDWQAGAWVNVGEQAATTFDSSMTGVATGTLSRFVSSEGLLRAKASWWQSGPVLVWPWTVSVDQVRWRVRAR